jgi:hypothetical protein
MVIIMDLTKGTNWVHAAGPPWLRADPMMLVFVGVLLMKTASDFSPSHREVAKMAEKRHPRLVEAKHRC